MDPDLYINNDLDTFRYRSLCNLGWGSGSSPLMDPDKQELPFPDHGFKARVYLKRAPPEKGVCVLYAPCRDLAGFFQFANLDYPILPPPPAGAGAGGGGAPDDAGKLQKKQQVQRETNKPRGKQRGKVGEGAMACLCQGVLMAYGLNGFVCADHSCRNLLISN
jgi:hypothetical protein